MNARSPRFIGGAAFILFVWALAVPEVRAVEALLLQDTYVDSGASGSEPPPNASNFGAGADLRVFKGHGRFGRTFLKFSFDTLPPGTTGNDIAHARLRLWVNSKSTSAGAITLSPVLTAWDEYTLKHNTARALTFGEPKLAELPVESINIFISIDVTAWVKAWLDRTLVNEGIVIEPSAGADFLDLSFDSKESDRTSHEARLEISFGKNAND